MTHATPPRRPSLPRERGECEPSRAKSCPAISCGNIEASRVAAKLRAGSEIVVEQRLAIADVAHDELSLLGGDALKGRAESGRRVGVVARVAGPAHHAAAIEVI